MTITESVDESLFDVSGEPAPEVVPVAHRKAAAGAPAQRAAPFEQILIGVAAGGLVGGIVVGVRVKTAHKQVENDDGDTELQLVNISLFLQKSFVFQSSGGQWEGKKVLVMETSLPGGEI